MIKKTKLKSESKSSATGRETLAKSVKKSPPAHDRAAAQRTPALHEVTFAVHKPDAERVFVSGAFNGWSTEATPLTRQPNRDWKATLTLPPGRHEYKFVVDGKWIIDPRAPHSTPNGFGSLNSIVEVKA